MEELNPLLFTTICMVKDEILEYRLAWVRKETRLLDALETELELTSEERKWLYDYSNELITLDKTIALELAERIGKRFARLIEIKRKLVVDECSADEVIALLNEEKQLNNYFIT
jgi:hypothetical protein